MNSGRLRLRVQVYTRKQLCQALENKDCEAVYAPIRVVDSGLSQYKDKLILLPPEYLADCEAKVREKLSVLKEAGFYRAAAHTVGHIELLSELGYEIHGGNRLCCLVPRPYGDEKCMQRYSSRRFHRLLSLLSPRQKLNPHRRFRRSA